MTGINFTKIAGFVLICWMLQSCASSRKTHSPAVVSAAELKSTVLLKKKVPARKIDVKSVEADDLVTFAETLLGVPYKYGSVKKELGFDCSGFINYVFNHFKVSVPRTSSDFTNAGREVKPGESKRGDLILFTASDANSGEVGHMGIITENSKNNFIFIHASSGKGVMFSKLNSYFIPRFVKVIRVFP